MTEIQEADEFNTVRAYTPWNELSVAQKVAALAVADDYIMANYAIKTELSEDEKARFSVAKYQLAREFSVAPPTLLATAPVQKQRDKMEGVGETETVFADAPADPYPRITGLLAPLSPNAKPSAAFYTGTVAT